MSTLPNGTAGDQSVVPPNNARRADRVNARRKRRPTTPPTDEQLLATARGLRKEARDLLRALADGKNPLAPELTRKAVRDWAYELRAEAARLERQAGVLPGFG